MTIENDKEKSPQEVYKDWDSHKEFLFRHFGFYTQSHIRPSLEEGLKLFDSLYDAHQWHHAKWMLGYLAHYVRDNPEYLKRVRKLASETDLVREARLTEVYPDFERMMVIMMDKMFGNRFKKIPWEEGSITARNLKGRMTTRKLKLLKVIKPKRRRNRLHMEFAIPDAGEGYTNRATAHPYVIEGPVQVTFGIRNFYFDNNDISLHLPRFINSSPAPDIKPHQEHQVEVLRSRARKAILEHTEPLIYKLTPQPDSHAPLSEPSAQHQQRTQPYSREKQSTPALD